MRLLNLNVVFFDSIVTYATQLNLIGWILAGLLVGIGTRMGSGCTSGHSVCGIPRLSKRSIVATIVFIITGMIVATFKSRHGLLDGNGSGISKQDNYIFVV